MTAMKQTTFIVEYDSNNSGGYWWLNDADWLTLEKAGWTVKWAKDEPYRKTLTNDDGRWLGALATSATIEIDAYNAELAEGVGQNWWHEALPHLDPYDEGCNCCGRPHSFYARAKS